MNYPRIGVVALLTAVAALGALGGCVLSNVTSRTDAGLLRLVERLVAAESSASVIAVGLTGATAILAAILIPFITVVALLRHEQNEYHLEDPVNPRRVDYRDHPHIEEHRDSHASLEGDTHAVSVACKRDKRRRDGAPV